MTKEDKNSQEHREVDVTRRKFLFNAGVLTAGAIAAGTLVGCATGDNSAPKEEVTANAQQAGGAPALPWKYTKLDVEVIRKRGYENYFKHGCMYGAAAALLLTLQETSGYPWNTIPLDMFQYGAGGAYSWGTLCGALNASLAVINLASSKHADLGNELIGWYTEFPFPSDKHEAYCKVPKQVTTVANSPLCHISVSTWASAAGAKINDKFKKDRCAKVTGDTAARAAEMLNDSLQGNFAAAYIFPEEYQHCMRCHQGPNSLLDDEQGKFNCLECHEDHSKDAIWKK